MERVNGIKCESFAVAVGVSQKYVMFHGYLICTVYICGWNTERSNDKDIKKQNKKQNRVNVEFYGRDREGTNMFVYR